MRLRYGQSLTGCNRYLSILAEGFWSERLGMDPLGGGPLHSLNDRTASVQRCMVTAAIEVQTVEEECHACKHQPNYCPKHAQLLFSVFLEKGSTLDASQTLNLILLDHSEAGLSLDKADKEDCESKQLVISHALI